MLNEVMKLNVDLNNMKKLFFSGIKLKNYLKAGLKLSKQVVIVLDT